MKSRMILLSVAFCLIGALCLAADANMGTWRLNEAKSKLNPEMPKKTVVVYSADGDKVKVVVEGVDANGKPTHNEWVGKYDGKDYPVTGDPSTDSRSIMKVDDNTLHIVNKKDGKTTIEVHVVLAPDGKSRTVTSTGTDSKGNKISSTNVYDKQ
jgi:hypothetical protein